MNVVDMKTGEVTEVPYAPDYSKMLDGWLTEWYEVAVLGHGKPSDTIDRFNRIATITPSLRAEAAKRLEALADIPEERCFITKTHRDFLRKVTQ